MLRDKFLLFGQRWIETHPWYLAPLSWIYAFAVYCRNKLYDFQLLSIVKVPCTVVSVGNIVAGGTGKTPFVHLLASVFSHRRVAILSRGYGKIPDEAILLARKLPQVKIYVGKDRATLAKIAAEQAELLILDDGFQHRRLYRDFDIVLVREKKERYLPVGFLRDSVKRLASADVIFQVERELNLTVKRILDLNGNEIASIQGWKVGIFCGIAHPQRFKKTVENLGAEIIFEKIFADHEQADLTKLPPLNAWICTEKDAVKLKGKDLPIYFLEMEMEIKEEKEKWEKLIEKIDQKIDNKTTYERSS
jgi:tetraacyldisaccharide 4'-kinase